jgi:hypothetical protein
MTYDKGALADLVKRAREFAVHAHTRINHRRKYHNLPYAAHLENVAALVASATDDPETLAAAWLHDVVEDTPATIEDVEKTFGRTVASLVESLTDVSRPREGNRAARKEIDRQHLAKAGRQAKTVKLADLIDNCRDICKHDERFARVYLQEMARLLEVLQEGDAALYRQAREAHQDCSQRLGMQPIQDDMSEMPRRGIWNSDIIPAHVIRHYAKSFTALDVADPLRSFDTDKRSAEVLQIMDDHALPVVCLRKKGLIQGYVQKGDLTGGTCGEQMRPFRPGQVIMGDESLTEVIRILTLYEYAFVSLLDEVVGLIHRDCLNRPVARMWLFGIITLTELELVRLISEHFPGDAWKVHVSHGRIEKAVSLHQERQRRNQQSSLIDCLQFSDKAQILMEKPEVRDLFGFESKRIASEAIKQLESLRNNLAHAQDVVTHDWAAIARIASRIEEAVLLRRNHPASTMTADTLSRGKKR